MVAGPGPENGAHALPTITIGADTHQFPTVPTPRDMTLSTPGIPSSSLDFLADISAHHGRTDPDLHPMMLDEQPQYFGWNEVTTADQAVQRNSVGFESVPNEMLQFWLEPRHDSGSNQGSLDMVREGHFPLMNDNTVMTPDQQNRNSADSCKPTNSNIPTERFFKVQRCWLAPPNHTGRLMNSLWRDIVYTSVDNIFSVNSLQLPGESSMVEGSRYGVDEDCRRRLQAVFAQAQFAYPPMQSSMNDAVSPLTSGSTSHSCPVFPPAEVLDMALDLYFRTFDPLVPFVHLPTFSAKATRPPLLYVMCLIGMMLLGTKGTTNFVLKNFTVRVSINLCAQQMLNKNFQHMLEKVTAELAKCTMGVESPASTMSIFTTAFLFLNLAVLTGVCLLASPPRLSKLIFRRIKPI